MPQILPLQAIPNQNLTTRLDDRLYSITVIELNAGIMGVTIERDGTTIVTNQRIVSGSPVLPYRAMWAGAGNFIFTTTGDGDLPTWADFGTTCQLVYSSAAEIAEAVANG